MLDILGVLIAICCNYLLFCGSYSLYFELFAMLLH